MNDEIIREFESFLSSISSEELKDMVDKYDCEFENGDFRFEGAMDFIFENSSSNIDNIVFSVGRFENPINCNCLFDEAA